MLASRGRSVHRCNSQFWLLVAVTFEVTARVVGRLKPYHISRSSHLHIRIWMVLNVVDPARTVPPFVISVASPDEAAARRTCRLGHTRRRRVNTPMASKVVSGGLRHVTHPHSVTKASAVPQELRKPSACWPSLTKILGCLGELSAALLVCAMGRLSGPVRSTALGMLAPL